jgi:hypothetical protein
MTILALGMSIPLTLADSDRLPRKEVRASVAIAGVSETTLSSDLNVPALVQDETLYAHAPSDVPELVRSAARYVQALAVLPVDPEYEARVDKMLAARAQGTRKKAAVRKLR